MLLAGLLLVPAALVAALPAWPPADAAPPSLLFGPLAHHPHPRDPGLEPGTKHVSSQTLDLLAGRSGAWDEVRGRIISSGGALHTSV